MYNVFKVERAWIDETDDAAACGDVSDESSIRISILVERSADLLGLDPAGQLRVACVAALDNAEFVEATELLEFADELIRARSIPTGQAAASILRRSIENETDHLGARLSDAAGAFYCDVTNFVVLLCAPEVEIDDGLLQRRPSLDPRVEDPHWRDVPLTDPQLTTEPYMHRCWSCDEPISDPPHGQLRPAADTCVVVASIGGEPSRALRHFAELTGGAAIGVRTPEDINALVSICRDRLTAVEAAIDRRIAEHDAWRDPDVTLFESDATDIDLASAAPRQHETTVEVSRVDAEVEASVLTALEAWEDWEPSAEDFVDVAVYVERSAAAIAADPSGSMRTHAVDALDRVGVGSGQLYSYGQGLIAEGRPTNSERMGGYARALLRLSGDHTRVDLPAALRQSQRLSGPMLVAVIGTQLATVPAELNLGTEWVEPGMSEAERTDLPSEPYAGEYGETIVLGVVGAEPSSETRERCEATGGRALRIRDAADLQRFGECCAAVYREMVETVEVDCVTGALDLDRVFGI